MKTRIATALCISVGLISCAYIGAGPRSSCAPLARAEVRAATRAPAPHSQARDEAVLKAAIDLLLEAGEARRLPRLTHEGGPAGFNRRVLHPGDALGLPGEPYSRALAFELEDNRSQLIDAGGVSVTMWKDLLERHQTRRLRHRRGFAAKRLERLASLPLLPPVDDESTPDHALPGVLAMSRPGYSPSGDRALVYVAMSMAVQDGDDYSAWGSYWIFRRDAQGWRFVREHTAWTEIA